jgi:hypothetical protein
LGYTPNRHVAIDGLEAVDEQEQRRQTHAAHREQLRRRMIAWATTRGAILSATEQYLASGAADRRTASDLRVVVRVVGRITARVANERP